MEETIKGLVNDSILLLLIMINDMVAFTHKKKEYTAGYSMIHI
jgi:hypothetical protein